MRGLKTAKEAKNRISEVHPAVKVAIGVMLRQAKHDLPAAAREAGLSTARLRDYLSRPSVIQYLRRRRLVEVETMCAGNIQALAKIRDEAAPTPAVNAIKESERIRAQLISEDGAAGASSRLAAPGLVLVIAPAPAVTVDQPQRLAGARTIIEAGARDLRTDDAAFVIDAEDAADEPGGEVAATYSR
jgi:hypothetical protein